MVAALLVVSCATAVEEEEEEVVIPAAEEAALPEEEAVTEEEETPSPEVSTIIIPTTQYERVKDIEYGRAGDIPLLLDIYIPEEPIISPMPAVIFMHGGGWRVGNKGATLVNFLASRGFFGVSIDYRLSGVALFPAAVEDCKCAVRWLRANAAEYNVDPDHIGVWGRSAGAHLAMMLGCADETAGLEGNGGWEGVSSRVQAICSYCGPSDFVTWSEGTNTGNTTAEFQFLGSTIEKIPDTYRLASPVTHVTTDDPPLLLVHGKLDQQVSFTQSEIMLQAYRQAGLETTLIEVDGAGHLLRQATDSPLSPSLEEIRQIYLDFFVKHLVSVD
jgi:acetyl esterase/lipase